MHGPEQTLLVPGQNMSEANVDSWPLCCVESGHVTMTSARPPLRSLPDPFLMEKRTEQAVLGED